MAMVTIVKPQIRPNHREYQIEGGDHVKISYNKVWHKWQKNNEVRCPVRKGHGGAFLQMNYQYFIKKA